MRIAAELRLGAAELRELNRIGVNLNQMARALNSGAVSSPAAMLTGRREQIHAARDRKLEQAREQRQLRRRQAV